MYLENGTKELLIDKNAVDFIITYSKYYSWVNNTTYGT